MLKKFLLDSLRILKKDGVIIHLIDIYCNNDADLQSGIVRDLIKNLEEIDSSFKCTIDDWSFKTSYCSKDDYTMWEWNSVAPHLEVVRNTHQSCEYFSSAKEKRNKEKIEINNEGIKVNNAK